MNGIAGIAERSDTRCVVTDEVPSVKYQFTFDMEDQALCIQEDAGEGDATVSFGTEPLPCRTRPPPRVPRWGAPHEGYGSSRSPISSAGLR